MPFTGLPKDYFAFFRELKDNNEKAWFEANRERYRDSVLEPLCDFVEAMAPRIAKISKHMNADPRPNRGSVFRIYRDVRFSKDKRPYKEHGAVQFRHVLGKDAHAPGYYVHLAPGEVFFGGGVWAPDPANLQKIRERIAEKPAPWRKVVEDAGFRDAFGGVRGDALTRPPRGFDRDHPLIEDIKRKSFFAMAQGPQKAAHSPGFLDEVEAAFVRAKPLMKFLCDAVDAPF